MKKQISIRGDVVKDRRSFLKGAGAALLAAAAVPEAAKGEMSKDMIYISGLVSNPSLVGLAGELILNIYLVVSAEGTSFGAMSDVVHPAVNSHLAVQETYRQGNHFRFEGEVIRSNDP